MRFLLASTGLGAIAVSIAMPALAETVVSTAVTAPQLTSTTGDLRISSTGSVKPTTGAAVTINSSNYVKNEGAIAIQGANGSTGILANPGLTGDITNSGTITIDENYTATDTDSDADIDGPFAQGSHRFGIRVAPGGSYTGKIVNSGTIIVEGNNSAGIAVDSALTGSINLTGGKINVLGDDSVGIRTGAVTGDVNVGNASSINVQGKNAVGVKIGGNVGGALILQGTVATTGYRYVTAPADTSKLDADDLLQGGPAVLVGGNVAGGILLDTRPADANTTDPDEDDDGIPDANETTASVSSIGSAPALKIGSATQDVSIGAVASSAAGHGLVIKGNVSGSGVYSGVNSVALDIGGTGHTVTVAGGMTLAGTVAASAKDANATAIKIGAGATVPQMVISGIVQATGSGTAATSAQAIVIEAGATVNTIKNSGAITAIRSGTDGTAAAIVDKSGSLTLVENSGSIAVAKATTLGDAATAIDLGANTTGATIRQVAGASGSAAPTIAGNIRFGTGDDMLDIQAGSVTGKIDFGGGADLLSLSGASLFRGTFVNSSNLAVTIGNGSTLDVQTAGTVGLGSLSAGPNSTLGVTIGETGHTLYNVAGAASFGAGTTIGVNLQQVGTSDGAYTIVDAGSLTGAGNLKAGDLPFLYDASISSDAAAGTVTLNLQRKTASELGLNASEAAIFNAALNAADSDQGIAATFLAATDGAGVRDTLQQLLPDHAGGVFEAVTKGTRLSGQILSDPRPLSGFWAQQMLWGSSKSIGRTSTYDVSGWGASAGYDVGVGKLGSVGVTASYLWSKDGHHSNELTNSHYEGGVYWRGRFGPVQAWARGTIGTVKLHSTRNFSATIDGDILTRTSKGSWNGTTYSGLAGLSYEARIGALSIRPNASVEYYKLKEKAYSESGGGDAFDLSVGSRDSQETDATVNLALGYDLVRAIPDISENWFRIELEGGRRQILSGKLGNTVASFKDGTPFTLSAEERNSGWRGGLRAIGGGSATSIVAEINAEQQQDDISLGARVGVSVAF